MKAFKRNKMTNDLVLDGAGGFSIVEGAESVGAALDAIVKTIRGKLAFDVTKGVPYFTTVFNGVITLPEWEEEMRMAIRACPHVTEIVSFTTEVNVEEEVLKYTAEVNTDEGMTAVAGTVGNVHWNVVGE